MTGGLRAWLRRSAAGHLGDGLAMSLAAGGAALVGMLSWILAARALTPAELGTASAFVSGFLLIAGCTEFNVGIGLLRWLPRAGGAATAMLLRAALIIAVSAAVAASCYLLLPDTSIIVDAVAGPAGAGGDDRLLGGAVFVLAAVLYAIFQQQDYVLVGLGRAWWAPARTLVFAVGRLGILVVAGASLTTRLVVASWVVPVAACVLLVLMQATVLLRRRRGAARWLPPRREVVGFLAGAYVGQVATSVMYNQVPLLTTFRFGPEAGASFFLAWQSVTVVDVVCLYFVSALSAGVAREPHRAAELSAATRRRLLALVLPALAVGVLIAGPALSLFGAHYAGEANVLRVMLVGLALRLLVLHRLGEHQAFGRGARYGRLAVANTVLIVGAMLAVPGGVADPLMTFAVAFVGVQAMVAAVVTVRRRNDPTSRGDVLIDDLEPGEAEDTMGGTGVGRPTLVSGTPRADAAVAVTVPVYQGDQTIEATLASILAQPDDDLEVVVLDNASTDRTAAILAAVDDPRVAVWRNPAVVPMLENFNRAVALTSAPLVKVMSADDLVEPGAVAEQARLLRADPSLAMVAGREHFVDATGRMLVRSRFLRGLVGTVDRRTVVRATLRRGGNPVGADVAVTFRRTAFEAAGGYRAPEAFADLDLWLRMLEHGHLHGQAATVARFRIRVGSRSAAADRDDDLAHDRYLASLVTDAADLGPGRRLWTRVRPPTVRWRRQLLFALVRHRNTGPVSAAATASAGAPARTEFLRAP